MNSLLRISASNHNIRDVMLLVKCQSLLGVSNSYSFPGSGRTPGVPPKEQIHLSKKNFSSFPNKEKFPNLTDFPVVLWPGPFRMIKNRIMSSLVIRRYFDKDFDQDKFTQHTKHAVERVSTYLAQGNFDELDELVTSDVLANAKENIKKFSLKDRMALRVEERDIMSCYTHNVGIIIPDRKGRLIQELTGERLVEITIIYHVLKGYDNYDSYQFGEPFTYLNFSRSFTVLNYRFIKNYTPGIDSYWIINGLNHSKPFQHLAL